MNYFLLLIIVGVCGGSYYMYSTDQEQITTLQQQVTDLTDQLKKSGGVVTGSPAVATVAPTTVSPLPAPALVAPGLTPAPAGVTPVTTVTPVAPTTVAPAPTPVAPAPGVAHSNAIDAAANAAMAAATNGSSVGTITTLDHKTYTNCKVLKVEPDGVTFSHDDGITKILYPMMPPDVQKEFGYTPQGAVAQTEAQIRATQQQAAATNGAAPQ